MDTIYLRDVELQATIGAYQWEQRIEQKLILNLSLAVDCQAAGASDDLNDALDYGAVLATVKTLVEQQRVALIEKLATLIADEILCHYPAVQTVTVDLAKVFIFPNVPRVGVVITRGRSA